MGTYKRVIVFGGHPLDAELMGGPFLMRYARKGAHCTFVHVTKGRLTAPNATEEQKAAYEAKLMGEQEAVAAGMGCDQLSFGYTSTTIPETTVLARQIEKYLEREGADCVITHARGTLHPRHYNTYEAVLMAVRSLRKKGSCIQLFFGENCEDLAGFTPTLYLSQTQDELDAWFKALSEYEIFRGTVNNMPYQEYYHALAIVRSVEAEGTGYAKAYMHAPLIDNE